MGSSPRVAILGRPGEPLARRATAAGYDAVYAPLVLGERGAPTLDDAVRDAELVIDFVPDELESKLEILTLLDRLAPPACTLATVSSALSVRDLASCTYRPQRVVALRLAAGEVVHLQHPPEALPEALAQVREFWDKLGEKVFLSVDESPLP